MAELAFGLSKTVVEALALKVKDAISLEVEQWRTVGRELEFIVGEFEIMQSFFKIADEERAKSNLVITWVTQLRNLSYDLEDCIEFVLHLDTKNTWYLRFLPHCAGKVVLPVDEAVDQVKQLKARVLDMSERNMRYRVINESGSKLDARMQEPSAASATEFDILFKARNAVKEQSGFWDLTGLINGKDADLQVISLCGTGGDLGMSSIIKKAYDNPKICKRFKLRAWVKLMHPFNPHDFIQGLENEFFINSCGTQGEAEGVDFLKMKANEDDSDLLDKFHTKVKEHKYLIVLEDLSSMVEWHNVRTYLPDMKNGSRIVVSTRQLEIASLCIGQHYQVLELRQFSADHSVFVFLKEVSHQDHLKDFRLEDMNERNAREVRNWLDTFLHVGCNSEADKLDSDITLTRNNVKPPMVSSFCGFAAVKNSNIVKIAYRRHMLKETFDKYAWVNVSCPFNLKDFSWHLLSSLNPESLRNEDPVEECWKLLHKYHCLVVIVGMQSKECWDMIKANLTSGTYRSCIFVITEKESVATHCAASEDATYNIKDFPIEKELEKAGVHQQRDMTKLKHILYKCGGLPEVIVALARHMADLREDTWEWEWMRLNDNFMHLLQTKSELGSIGSLFTWIHSKIRGCPQPVKKCMFYLSIFPQNSIIRRRRLVRRWIAEGFSEPTDSKSLEDYMEELFHKLAALGMVQRPPQTNTMAGAKRMSFFQVSGFFREYVISRPREEKVFFPVEVTVLDEGHRLTTERVGQHIAIGENWERDRIVFDGMNFERLRSLTVFGDWTPFFISEKMRVLRVLDLENASGSVTNKDLEVMVALLPRLKFLSLRGCKEITHLPSSLGTLRQLQTLDIRHTSVEYLPVSILRLKRLNYIRAGTMHSAGYNGGVDLPRIEQMTALHTLGVVNVIYHYGLRRLTQLHKLGVSGISQKNSRQLLSAISGHNHLESLSLVLAKDNHVVSWDGINYPKNLRSLKLYGHVQMLPPQIKELRNLEKLSLEIISFTEEDIKVLGKLENLQILRLFVKMFDNGQLQFPIMGDDFPQLKVLEIDCNSNLHICFPQRTVRNLEVLKVCYHSGSPLQLSGLDHMISLKKVWLKGPSDGALLDSVRQQLDRNPKKPVFVPVE
uniref:Rx N-terminal domain-containing protein n=1 Tax=Setaria italica TaxID=4555 RepID=K3ZEE4_SETIT